MKTVTLTTLAFLALTATATGCAAPVAEPSASGETADALDGKTTGKTADESSVVESLRRLQALEVVDMDLLSTRVREEASCYRSETSIGLVCIEDLEPMADEIAAGDRRLAAFADAAEKAVEAGLGPDELGAFTPSDVAADLDALKALQVVDVGAFVTDQPENGNCYGYFCLSSNNERAAKLHAIAKAAEKL